jgi:GH15 family glucan-1,4-alpha-glucosidase
MHVVHGDTAASDCIRAQRNNSAASDHLELSEQYDGTSGYERSVRDLTWSYAAFLSAVRAKTGVAVRA